MNRLPAFLQKWFRGVVLPLLLGRLLSSLFRLLMFSRFRLSTLGLALVLGERERVIDNLMDWASKPESADPEGHKKFLEEAGLPTCDSPLEAIPLENGFLPEALGIPTDRVEHRIQGSLPPLACIQAKTTGQHR